MARKKGRTVGPEIFVYDVETHPEENDRFLCSVLRDIRTDRIEYFDDEDKARARLGEVNGRVYAHNAAYDHNATYHGTETVYMMNGSFRRSLVGRALWLDTFGFFDVGLGWAGENLTGIKKTGIASAVHHMTEAERRDYCISDTEGAAALVHCILDFARRFDLKSEATGTGAWAREFWKRCEPWVEVYPDDLKLRHYPADAMRGGVVYADHDARPLLDCVKYDIKSAYPWQMVCGVFPDLEHVQLAKKTDGLPVVLLEWYDEHLERDVWGPEEEHQASRTAGPVKRVLRCPRRHWLNPFRSYIDTLIQHRNEAIADGDKARSYLVKKVMNSLAGALGSRRRPQIVSQGLISGGDIAERGLPGTRTLWASLITGRNRARILNALRDSDTAVYSDTDSVICKRFADDGQGDERLGFWELEAELQAAWIIGPKIYMTHSRGEDSAAAELKAWTKGAPKRAAVNIAARYLLGQATEVLWSSAFSVSESYDKERLWGTRRRDPMKKVRQRDRERGWSLSEAEKRRVRAVAEDVLSRSLDLRESRA